MNTLRLPVLFLLLCAVAQAALKVATYNVENYTLANRMVDGVYRESYPKPENERVALTQVIGAIAPDVLAVQEMGTKSYLDEFQRELKAAGQDYPHTVVLDGPDANRHVAVLSKVPFKEVKPHADVPFTYFDQPAKVRRGALEVIIATDQGDVSIFVVHLKSKYTERKDDPESLLQRSLEAEAVRDLVLTRFPDPAQAKFLVVGDWNDTRSTRPVRALQKRGDLVVGELVRAADSRGHLWTHFFRREDQYSRIDYLMVSPGLKSHVVGNRATIHDGPGTVDASDHRPVWLTLDVQPKAGR
ncbi:endonuclease/exonuclease/phosphatase family protein [Oleiharenicola lentus]|jgi:endonuclease/exonuclease/phosphatase family metal-dependent hydrolase|uniref:Endonuclease/exonuclease/phosphatase family protein n=1 Tax=Oleiharenicola lentus TaxID=2508720 RepID=A0A4Q1C9X8_9BACT|nr:endonuclease/exonuclease/phosphatase family protein [Oleiharenicola lentus]RXK55867.1 endonuclease/exonuclease/phosphatase family protein [Oleiharenicola lentus]